MTTKQKIRTDAERRRHIENWHNSNLSKADYCKRHNIKVNTFYKWLRIFKQKQEKELHLVPIGLTSFTAQLNPSAESGVFVSIGNYKIGLHEDFCSSTFRKVVKELESL